MIATISKTSKGKHGAVKEPAQGHTSQEQWMGQAKVTSDPLEGHGGVFVLLSVSGCPVSWRLSFSVGFVGVRFLTDGPLHFSVCCVEYPHPSLGGPSSGSLVSRFPLGLGVPPNFPIVDLFLEVISLGEQFLFS